MWIQLFKQLEFLKLDYKSHYLLPNGTEEKKEFEYKDLGSMATIGRNKAVADLGKLKLQGLFAWFVWMFIHLIALVGFRNKVITFFNWSYNYLNFDRGVRLIIRKFEKNQA